MKKTLFMAMTAVALLITSCSKESINDVKPEYTNKVTIDGADYTTVKIGTQTWTTVNYNSTGGTNYDNSSANIAANGKLYTIAEAKAVKLPIGWRVPTSDDFTKLLTSQGSDANKLIPKTGWPNSTGTNTSGFNALAVGYYSNAVYDGKGTDAVFITTSILPDYNVPASFNINQENKITEAVLTDIVVTDDERGSLRFVKDN